MYEDPNTFGYQKFQNKKMLFVEKIISKECESKILHPKNTEGLKNNWMGSKQIWSWKNFGPKN